MSSHAVFAADLAPARLAATDSRAVGTTMTIITTITTHMRGASG